MLIQGISVCLDQLRQSVDLTVQREHTLFGRAISTIVLQYNGRGQFIFGNCLTVSVIEISPGAFQRTGSCDLHLKVVCIILAVNNLQREQACHQRGGKSQKTQAQDRSTITACLF